MGMNTTVTVTEIGEATFATFLNLLKIFSKWHILKLLCIHAFLKLVMP